MKKLLVIILTILLLVANSYTNSVNAAVDTQFRETIASASGRVYVIKSDGTLWYWGKGTFNDYITRAEFCSLAVLVYETVTEEKLNERKPFSDTNNVDVEKMGALGVVDGIGDGLFNPDGNLTREQAAVVLARLADSIGIHLLTEAANYVDTNEISIWAREFVGQMQAAGIMGGVGENAFSPKGAYTREQVIITMVRLFNAVS